MGLPKVELNKAEAAIFTNYREIINICEIYQKNNIMTGKPASPN
jgi:hypothetical protein